MGKTKLEICCGGAVYPPEDRYQVGDVRAVGDMRRALTCL